ncbi:WD40-repeat-containing domain [Pseudocohnilembus persalinus]|uniref:WD40-repeat-containing domain n=1 Tax=Pseudocohnilembus persalinus TaxID=266149 RepID=A0A0V0QSN0_PSEPJ|nr:WD40-repeat-containing domain [Pseudocohnilembus persalinus]|eukprot:KRX05326.1 WD40-repeat-containing domain [Pseudocohnilembus persalinus]
MGIGQALALKLAEADFNIVIISNDQAANTETLKMLKNKNQQIQVRTLTVDFLNYDCDSINSLNKSQNLNHNQHQNNNYNNINNNNYNNNNNNLNLNIQNNNNSIYDSATRPNNQKKGSIDEGASFADNISESNRKNIPHFLDLIEENFQDFLKSKQVTILANCAGIQPEPGMIEDVNPQDVINTIQVNSIALMQITKLSLEYFNQDLQQKKAIINMGYMSKLVYLHSYCISKSIVEGFGQSLNIELGDKNIHILTMTPWQVSTRMSGYRDTFFIINADQLAKQILIDLYNEKRESNGHYKHELINYIYKILRKISPKLEFQKKEQDWKKSLKSIIQLDSKRYHIQTEKNKYFSEIGIKKMTKKTTPMPDIFRYKPWQTLDFKIKDDFYLNIFSWSNNNLISIGLEKQILLYNPSSNKKTIINIYQPKIGQYDSQFFNLDYSKQFIDITDQEIDKPIDIYKNNYDYDGNDNLVFVWNIFNMEQPLYQISTHKAAIKALDWHPKNSNILISGGGNGDNTIQLHNIQTKQKLIQIDAISQVCNLYCSEENQEIVSTHGYSINQICIWDLKTFKLKRIYQYHLNRVSQMAVNPKSGKVISGSGNDSICIWNIFPSQYSNLETFDKKIR